MRKQKQRKNRKAEGRKGNVRKKETVERRQPGGEVYFCLFLSFPLELRQSERENDSQKGEWKQNVMHTTPPPPPPPPRPPIFSALDFPQKILLSIAEPKLNYNLQKA